MVEVQIREQVVPVPAGWYRLGKPEGGLPAPVWKYRNTVSGQGPIARRFEQAIDIFQGYFAAVVKKSLTDT